MDWRLIKYRIVEDLKSVSTEEELIIWVAGLSLEDYEEEKRPFSKGGSEQ